MIGDGGQISSRGANEFEAAKARKAGIRILVLCAPGAGSCPKIRGIVADPADYFEFLPPDVDTASAALIQRLMTRRIVAASLEHRLDPAVEPVAGSIVPPPSATGPGFLRWDVRAPVPPSLDAAYGLAPRVETFSGIAVTATLTLTDDLGATTIASVNTAHLDIIGPCISPSPTPSATPTPTLTPTPTATPSSTPTATPTPSPTASPGPIYLPLALTERCDPAQLRIDVALVIDASTSMAALTAAGRPKIDAALDAAGVFLDLLDFGPDGDQAALIAFNADARLLAPLTDDRPTLDTALAEVTLAQQTRLDLAVAEGARALADAGRRRAANQPVLVLLTDGRANPVPVDVAVAEATRAKEAGVTFFTIGLGDDLDEAALEAMASKRDGFLRAPDAENLSEAYRQVARRIPCPASAWWGRR